MVLRTLTLIHPPGSVIEIRMPKSGRLKTVSGYFNTHEVLAEAVARYAANPDVPGIYVTLNECKRALFARAANVLKPYADTTTADDDIGRRRALGIDFDPKRPAKISSTKGEHSAAIAQAERCRAWLSAMGWPEPIYADSGNGAHLVYGLDLPNDDEARQMLEKILVAIELYHSTPEVLVDTGVFNAARIWKLYGTMARKGSNIPDRPHRLSRILEAPDMLTPVPRALLQAVAEMAPSSPTRAGTPRGMSGQTIDAARWLAEHGVEVQGTKPWRGGTLYQLAACPWNPDHTDNDARVIQFANGALDAGCFHNGCQGKGWRDLRELMEPRRTRSGDRSIPVNGNSLHTPVAAPGDEPQGDEGTLDGFPPAKLTLADKLAGMTLDPDTGELGIDEHAARRTLEWAQDGEHLTELGNARRLVRQHGQDLRYCAPMGGWLVWTGTHWQPDATAEVVRHAKQTVASIYAEAADAGDKATRAELAKHAMKSEAAAKIEAMIKLANSEAAIRVTPEQLDADPWALNVLNGVIDLRSGQLRPHGRKDLLTRLAPVIYDSHAHDDIWEQFLDRILPDPDLRAFVQRALGYSLTGLTTEEVLFFPYGPTATGKSTLLGAVGAALGDYAGTADFETFLARDRASGGPRNDIARLHGRRFVVSLEVDEGKHLAEALIKQLTGGDAVSARFLYREAFEFIPSFKLWLAANSRPRVRDDDDAMWRRILQMPFNQQISEAERDPKVKAHLRDPAKAGPAVLAWAVKGCLTWQGGGLGVPKVVKDTTRAYRDEMDPLRDFLTERCVIDPQAEVTKAKLWGAYEGWAKATGVRALASRQFSDRLRRMGFDEDRNRTSRFWIGVDVLRDTRDARDTKSHNFEPNSFHEPELLENASRVSRASRSPQPHEREPGEEG